MTTTAPPRPPAPGLSSLEQRRLPSYANLTALAAIIVLAAVLYFALSFNPGQAILLGWLIGVVALVTVAFAIEGRRFGMDRLVTVVVTSAFALAMYPLGSIIFKVIQEGGPAISAEFLTHSMYGVGPSDTNGGIYHAILGTLIITALAALMSIPIGLFTAIYLVEYSDGNWFGNAIRFLVDVMTGIPSIVAGLFAYAMFSIFFGPGVTMGFGGSVALSVLMIPVVVRSSEEMLKLVPNELREASYALGVPKWRTIVKVVLPTALAGIVTGILLAIARVIGETAPLLIIAGVNSAINWNPFSNNPMTTLPVFAYQQNANPGSADCGLGQLDCSAVAPGIERAWGAALALMVIVMLLNLIGRLVSYAFSPKGEK